jgi:hypothetical protein
MTKPTFSKIPSELRDRPQWVVWKLVDRDGKPTKLPIDPKTGRPASSTDAATWASFDEAVAAHERGGSSDIGFVFTADDPFCGVDLDHVRDPQTGAVEPWARDVVKRLNSYAELSQSGTGAHVIIRGQVPGDRRRTSIGSTGQGVEMYDSGRYFCMTGRQLAGTPGTVEERQEVLNTIHAELFHPEPAATTLTAAAPAAGGPPSLTDRELVEKAGTAKNGATFAALWRGDWQGAGHGSQSDADAALLGMLRFWTGGDKGRAFALFAQSGLSREKWTEREDYRERTWAAVASGEVYHPAATVSLGGGEKSGTVAPSNPPGEWGVPEPFSAAGAPLAPWPWEAFPAALAEMGKEIVRTIGTSDALPGLGLLCAASIALRNKLKIEIKKGHVQFPNLYGLTVLAPGEKKTPVGKVLLPPFQEWQWEQREVYVVALRAWKAKARVAKVRATELEKQAAAVEGEKARAIEAQIAEQERIIAEKPMPPVLLVNDSTPEAIARLMRDNGGALGVFTSEGRKVFQIAGGRYTKSGEADLSLWLAAYSADYWRCDRASADREPIELPEPVLAALVMTQPDTLRTLGESAEMRESGFLARWDFVCPSSTGGHYRVASIPPATDRKYRDAIRKLIDLPWAAYPDGTPAPHLIGLTPDGFERWRGYHDELAREAEQAAGIMPPAFIQYLVKLPERVARIAGIFRAVRHVAEGLPLGAMDAGEIDAAYMVTLALLSHGKRAFGLMGQSPDHAKARVLWRALDERREKLRAEREREGLGRVEAVKPKDVHRYGWAGIEDTEEARRVLEILSTKGWLSDAITLPGAAKGQQHCLFYLHPNPPKEGGKP